MVVRTFRNFGKNAGCGGDPRSRRGPERQLRQMGLEALFREIFPIESYDKKMTLEYICYELEKPHYTPLECRQLRLTYAYPLKIHCRLRVRERRGHGRAGDLPGRDARDDRRRRVHHQRRRARDRQPVAPQPRRGLPHREQGRRPRAARRPDHSRARKLDRDQRDQEGHSGRQDRPVQQDSRHHLPAGHGAEYGNDRRDLRLFYPTKNVRQQAGPRCGRSPRSWTPETGEILVEAGRQIGEKRARIQQSDLKKVEVIDRGPRPADPQHAGRGRLPEPRAGPAEVLHALRPGNPPQSRRPRRSSPRSSSTRTATAWARSAGSAQPQVRPDVDENEMTLRPRTSSTR
jgi:DNA-directed RNA polymerase subunit beta